MNIPPSTHGATQYRESEVIPGAQKLLWVHHTAHLSISELCACSWRACRALCADPGPAIKRAAPAGLLTSVQHRCSRLRGATEGFCTSPMPFLWCANKKKTQEGAAHSTRGAKTYRVATLVGRFRATFRFLAARVSLPPRSLESP